MAQKGQFKQPVMTLTRAVERAMEIIDGYNCDVAIFMVGGAPRGTKCTSASYDRNLRVLANNLVGVYNRYADARSVREDLKEFYK